jgi:hypothetical protein
VRPRPGDVVEIVGDRYYAKNGKAGCRGVIDSTMYGEDLFMVVLGASAFFGCSSERPSCTHEHECVSCSGGPCPAVHLNELVAGGQISHRFWHWKDYPRAGGGVDYVRLVNLWFWEPKERVR